MNSLEKEIFLKAAAKWGWELQTMVASEEAAEFIQALSKWWRKGLVPKGDAFLQLCEEMADLEIMLDQLKCITGVEETVQRYRAQKVLRLNDMVNDE